jgi:hypothetical protein
MAAAYDDRDRRDDRGPPPRESDSRDGPSRQPVKHFVSRDAHRKLHTLLITILHLLFNFF